MQGGPRASQLSLVLSEKVGVAGGLLRHIVQAGGGRAVVAAAAASMLRANTLNDLCKYEHGTEKDADEDPGGPSDAAPKCMGSELHGTSGRVGAHVTRCWWRSACRDGAGEPGR